jgi:transposase
MKATTVIGIDISDKYSQLAELDGSNGELILESRFRSKPSALEGLFGSRAPVRVVLEAGGHSGWMSRALAKWGHEVFVANPRRIKLSHHQKSDRVDAEMLARIGRVDPKLLQPVRLRTQKTQIALTTIRSRHALVETRTKLVNHVRAMVKGLGERLPSCSAESFHKRLELLPEALRPALEPLMNTIEDLTRRIRAFDRSVEQMCKEQYPETERLRQVTGVGPITALTFILILEEPSRFRNSRAVGPYLGLCPGRSQSGDKDPQLRITKAGDSMLRKLLVGAANYILGPFGPDTELRRWGNALAARGGKNAKKRATVAVARKLCGLLYSLWRSGEDYEPNRRTQGQTTSTKAEDSTNSKAQGPSRRSRSRDPRKSQERPSCQAPS